MGKSRSLAILMLGLACLFLITCKTGGTPKQSDGTPTKSRGAAGPQAPPPADSASKNRTASYSGDVGSIASPKLKDLKIEAVNRLGKPSIAIMGQPIKTMRAIIYAILAVIFMVVIGAIAAERVGRQRKLAPSPLNARH
jgi:hypothetical protein